MIQNYARFGECISLSIIADLQTLLPKWQAIDNLANVDGETLVVNFPVLLNQLFSVLTSRSLPAATSAFTLLPHILQW